jgi:hypothetical protein
VVDHRVTTWRRPFQADFRRTLAIFCCDGRYSRYIDEFLETELRVPGADWLAVPGGPASLGATRMHDAGHDALLLQVRFLVRAHATERIVLVFHDDCAYYQECLGAGHTTAKVRAAAVSDAAVASKLLLKTFPHMRVEAYWQSANDTTSLFQALGP